MPKIIHVKTIERKIHGQNSKALKLQEVKKKNLPVVLAALLPAATPIAVQIANIIAKFILNEKSWKMQLHFQITAKHLNAMLEICFKKSLLQKIPHKTLVMTNTSHQTAPKRIV